MRFDGDAATVCLTVRVSLAVAVDLLIVSLPLTAMPDFASFARVMVFLPFKVMVRSPSYFIAPPL